MRNYSITSPARVSSVTGDSMPSALAVSIFGDELKLSRSLNGKYTRLFPFRKRSI
jgi:hypothetical protein